MEAIALLFLILCFAGGLAILWAAVCAVRMLWHFKSPAERFSSKTIWNPMNVLLSPTLLTPKGLNLRRQVGYAIVLFVGCMVLAAIIGLLAKAAS
ncbi:hypothetical protein P3W24_18415 [Luteibacter sp. PPL201]|jgi:TRAP-type C4-dicarboxylate transport system permease small subunit|uniref:YggT family protein n=1 Tax=Luteibacter sahnii TaxID=3021977 RepID=A0ABT6BGY4_9GAMM